MTTIINKEFIDNLKEKINIEDIKYIYLSVTKLLIYMILKTNYKIDYIK